MARSIVMVMAGLFGGGTIGLISATMATIYRIIIGGAGVWAGSATIVGTMFLGLGFRRLLNNRPSQLTDLQLFGVGFFYTSHHAGMPTPGSTLADWDPNN